MSPEAFTSMLTNPANNQEPEAQEQTDKNAEQDVETETQEEEVVADKDALETEESEGSEAETKADDSEENTEKADEEKETKEIPEDERLHDVKVDGVKEQVSTAELKKSYERFKASTQRFMEASELKKQADYIQEQTDKKIADTKQALIQLKTNPETILSFCDPQALHAALEQYATRYTADQELREKDPSLYNATLEQRRRDAELKRRSDEIERRQKEIEANQAKQKQEAEKSAVQKTVEVYNSAVPEALKSAGVPDEMVDSMLVKSALKELVNSAWPDDLALKDLPQLVAECAKELVKDPAIKAVIGNGKQAATKEEKEKTNNRKKGVTVTDPASPAKKRKFIRPDDFFKQITGR